MNPVDPEVPFAFWLDPVSGIKVNYALPLFHEIDFQVNEGYRRIPHGGVEVGGILYGRADADSITIQASRPIDCEHASGPSFQLSERDLATLKESILASARDEELHGLLPLGWFISHSRSALRMTERELQLFQQFFPEPQRITILVKPERFKPTRFSMLLRDAAGRLDPEGETKAIILPLPGRSGQSGIATAAIPAPAAQEIPPHEGKTTQSSEPLAFPEPLSAGVIVPPIPAGIPLSPELPPVVPQPETDTTRRAGPLPRAPRKSRPGRFILILFLAALLGCSAGYWAYLQLPPPIIPLRVQRDSKGLLILWDPAQTQSARYAMIRVNDSGPALLTEEQKSAGIAQVPLSGDSVKIEILAQHWVRESRGIVRFIPAHPVPAPPAAGPDATLPSKAKEP